MSQDGLLFYQTSSGVSESTIQDNTTGLNCQHYSDPLVSLSKIEDNGTGVAASDGSYPALGYGTSTYGHNCFHLGGTYHIVNLSAPGQTIWARHNYWGKACCKPTTFYGDVTCDACTATCMATAQMVAALRDPSESDRRNPATFALRSGYPNPFNPAVTIRYEVPAPGSHVRISIFNVMGQRVADLVNGHNPGGYHTARWGGLNRRGMPVASGVYFVQMRASGFVATKKIVLMK